MDDFVVEETRKTIIPVNPLVCKGDSITLNAQGSSQSFYWSYDKIDTLSTALTINVKPSADKTIYLLSANNIDSIDLKVINPPLRILPMTILI